MAVMISRPEAGGADASLDKPVLPNRVVPKVTPLKSALEFSAHPTTEEISQVWVLTNGSCRWAASRARMRTPLWRQRCWIMPGDVTSSMRARNFSRRVVFPRIQRAWLRASVRAIAFAMAFTPTIAPVPSLHGALPMPAAWVLFCGISGLGSEDRMLDVRYGGIPLLVVFSVVWLTSMAVILFRRERPS